MGKQISPKFVLGLDVGTSSVGWALLEAPGNKPNRIVKTGARVFEAGVEGQLEQGKEKSRNKKSFVEQKSCLSYPIKLKLVMVRQNII